MCVCALCFCIDFVYYVSLCFFVPYDESKANMIAGCSSSRSISTLCACICDSHYNSEGMANSIFNRSLVPSHYKRTHQVRMLARSGSKVAWHTIWYFLIPMLMANCPILWIMGTWLVFIDLHDKLGDDYAISPYISIVNSCYLLPLLSCHAILWCMLFLTHYSIVIL